MSISLITALTIQNQENDIRCLAGGPDPASGKWAGWISIFRDGSYHTDLLSTQPIYDSEADGKSAMEKVVAEIRAAKFDSPTA